MRILVVGAGALGGYFGGRLLEVGRDVTFLVRERRKAQLRQGGLVIRSSDGETVLHAPPTVLSSELVTPFDVIVVACKAYDLQASMETFACAVGSSTMVVPLLNGMRHLELLASRFGSEKVLGGYCAISASVSLNGEVLHHSPGMHALTFGELDGRLSLRVLALQSPCQNANMQAGATETVLQEMWEKWIFLAALAGLTCLMRASIGDIVAIGRADLAMSIFDECNALATRQGFGARPASIDRSLKLLTTEGSDLTASMLKDIEGGHAVEADHILGDFLARDEGLKRADAPLLTVAYAHLQAYEIRRTRNLARSI